MIRPAVRPAVRLGLVLAWAAGAPHWLAACATNPVTGRADFVMMTEAREIELGRINDPQIRAHFGVYEDEALQTYVQRVGERLAARSHRPELIYRFAVLDTPDVNAFALPGGYIYVTRGLLAYLNSEAELAAVLGHEIGHVTARHSVRQYSAAAAGQILGSVFIGGQAGQSLFNVIGGALLSGYGREHELQADRLGAEYLARTRYDPDAMLRVIEVLKNQEEYEKQRAQAEGREPRIYHGVFASHPSADRRLQEVVAEAREFGAAGAPRNLRDEYLDHIDGLVFGDSARTGVRRDTGFYHRDLNFAVRFPAGWRLDNAPDAVTAYGPERAAVIELRSEQLNKRMTPEAYLEERLEIDDLQQGAPLPGMALPSYSGITRMGTPFGRTATRVSVVYHENRAFVFLAAAETEAGFAEHGPRFVATAASFHPLRPEEKQIAEGLRLRVIRARAGETFAGLARTSPVTNYPELVLRLINDKYPDGEPAAGERIKVVE